MFENIDPILIVDDQAEVRMAIGNVFERSSIPYELSHSAADCLSKVKTNKYSVIFTDLTMPKKSGLELLKELKNQNHNTPIIIITAHGSISTAVESMKWGAFDYIEKPFDYDTIIFIAQQAIYNKEKKAVPQENLQEKNVTVENYYREIITADKGMQALLKIAKENLAPSTTTVLIQAESGTGKELFARYIHHHSLRNNNTFVAVNCAALPENLLESELFGHKKGAFTGAIGDRKGKFELAHKGTILLDEISEINVHLQAKLLRVLQEKIVDKIGDNKPIPIDTRVIATTNRELTERVKEGTFREDLYYRLNVFPLVIPPIRERKGDIIPLAQHFVEKYAAFDNKKVPKISKETEKILKHYNWKGNVREIENVMARALLLCEDGIIVPENLLIKNIQK